MEWPSYNTPVNFLQLDHAACTRDGPSLCRWTSVSITDPRYLKWSTFLSSSPSSVICNGFSLVDRCSVFATLIFRRFSVTIFCHDSSLIWVSVVVNSIIARSRAYSSSHGSSDRISWDLLHIHIVRSWLRRIWPHWLSVVLSDSWLDSSSTNAFDDVMMASWWNGCCCFLINFNIAMTFPGLASPVGNDMSTTVQHSCNDPTVRNDVSRTSPAVLLTVADREITSIALVLFRCIVVVEQHAKTAVWTLIWANLTDNGTFVKWCDLFGPIDVSIHTHQMWP